MDKRVIVSGVLFSLSEIFAIASLAHTDWINFDSKAGSVVLGLTQYCQTVYGRKQECFSPELPVEWILSLISLVLAILAIGATCAFVFSIRWRRTFTSHAKWSGFAAITCLCNVGVLFPIGFGQAAVGGEAYKLPEVWRLGASYRHLWVYTIVFSCAGLFTLMLPIRMLTLNR